MSGYLLATLCCLPAPPSTDTCLGSLDELLCGRVLVFLVAPPRPEGRGLQGPAVREAEDPGLGQWAGVDGVQVHGGLLLALPSREKSHSCTREKEKTSLTVKSNNVVGYVSLWWWWWGGNDL